MTLVDSNIPMYLVGADHPNKQRAQHLLERSIVDGIPMVTDAEVYQEILHRYVGIKRKDMIPLAYEALDAVVDQVLPVDSETMRKAKELVVQSTWHWSARDALHLAVMQQHNIQSILSFDSDFDHFPSVVRVSE